MSAKSTDTPSSEEAPRKLKILMLHGYTQNGALFHGRTRSLEKALKKAFPSTSSSSLKSYPGGIELLYPTGPFRLQPNEIPGFDAAKAAEATQEREAYGWWKMKPGSSTEYAGFEEGLQSIAECIRTSGPIDGVIGFSQGAAGASFVASLLESNRRSAFDKFEAEGQGMKFPQEWEGLNDPLKFAVSYSGFLATHELYRGFYEPKIQTPVLNVIGSLDAIVEESKSLALAKACAVERVVYHPGGHFLPVTKEGLAALVAFIREICAGP